MTWRCVYRERGRTRFGRLPSDGGRSWSRSRSQSRSRIGRFQELFQVESLTEHRDSRNHRFLRVVLTNEGEDWTRQGGRRRADFFGRGNLSGADAKRRLQRSQLAPLRSSTCVAMGFIISGCASAGTAYVHIWFPNLSTLPCSRVPQPRLETVCTSLLRTALRDSANQETNIGF